MRQRSAPSRTSPIEGILDGRDLRFALVVARFNDFVTSRLLSGAQDCLTRHGVDPARIGVVRVPGSWEIPLAASVLARSGRYDGIVALGVLVRGETPHFDVLAGEVARGLSRVTMDSGVPVGFGVLTTESVDQAIERAGAKSGNKGWDAALSALEMASLLRGLA